MTPGYLHEMGRPAGRDGAGKTGRRLEAQGYVLRISFSRLDIARRFMKVAKWGNSLAVRLPRELVETMRLKAGDELEIASAGNKRLAISRRDRGAQFLEAIKDFNWPAPPGYRFYRDEANER